MKNWGIGRRSLLAAAAVMCFLPLATSSQSVAAEKMAIRISTPAVPGDWHAEQLSIFKEYVERSLPGQFDVQIFLNATLFKQGTEPAQMMRGNLDMAMISAQDIAKQLPQYSIFTAGYLIRDPEHQKAVFYGDVGQEYFKAVSDSMDVQILAVGYLGTRQLNLRDVRDVKTPADLKGVKLRMPGSKAWQFLGEALGASPTPLAFNEVYLSLKTGTHRRPGQPVADRSEGEVLRGHEADRTDQPSGRRRVPFDREQDVEQAQRRAEGGVHRSGSSGRRIQQQQSNSRRGPAGRVLQVEGMTITEPDRDAFRTHVQKMYLDSEFSKEWPAGLLDRINAAGK